MLANNLSESVCHGAQSLIHPELHQSTWVQFPAIAPNIVFLLIQTIQGTGDCSHNLIPASHMGDLVRVSSGSALAQPQLMWAFR